jgi:hypothetical protein
MQHHLTNNNEWSWHSMDMFISASIWREYELYNKLEAFVHGYQDYVQGRLGLEPYPADSIDGQAYDRGLEAAARTARKAREMGYRLNGQKLVQQ